MSIVEKAPSSAPPALVGDRFDPIGRAAVTAVRIAVGILWLSNSEWKVPTHFGGLRDFVQRGVDKPVFPPFTWILEHIVLKQMTLFGFVTLITESTLAALLLLGWKTRIVALVGAAQALFIGLSVANVDGEWPWSYWLLVGVHLLLFAVAAGRYGGLDGSLARGSRRTPGLVIGASCVIVGLWSGLTAKGDGRTLQLIKEVKLFRSTLAGGLVLAVVGAVVLALTLTDRFRLLAIPAAVAAVLALLTYAIWRDDGSYPLGLGYDGKGIAVMVMLAVGLGLLARGRDVDLGRLNPRTRATVSTR